MPLFTWFKLKFGAGYGAEFIIFAIKNAELIAELIAESFQKPPIYTARLQN